jgi:putative spermidine/putrescine transport system permease protein
MRQARGRSRWYILLCFFCGAVLFLLVAPSFIVLPMSLNTSEYFEWPPTGYSIVWYQRFFTDPKWQSALFNSLQTSVASVLLATVVGTLAAIGVHRARWRYKSWLELIILLPLIVPTVIFAIAEFSLLGALRLLDSLTGLISSYTVILLPLVFLNVRAGLYGLDSRLEFAAASLGATPLRAFARVTLPLLAPSIFAGALLALATAWDEAVLAIFITGTHTSTLPKEMWNGIRSSSDPTIVAISALLIILSLAALVFQALRYFRPANAAKKT